MRKRPFLHKKSGFSAYFVQPSEALLGMPPGGCAGLAGAAVYLCARARLPRRDDRQRAAGRPRPRERREYLAYFLPLVGSSLKLSDPLPPPLEAGARAAMVERPPHEAEIPLDALARAPFPKLVVTGGHNPAFDAVADVLEQRLGARRAVVPGAGHSIPRAPGYTETLIRFLESA